MYIYGSTKNKVALVTGGSSGIGEAIAKRFAKEGAKVLITGRHEDTLKKVADSTDGIDYLVLDMTAPDAVEIVKKALDDKYDGQLDILVNNADWCPIQPLEEITEKSYDNGFDLDVKAAVLLAAGLLPYLKKTQGNIINMSSVGGEHPAPNISVYVAAKAAIENLTKSWANELAKDGIRVNAIAPGAIETNIWNVPGATQKQMDENLARVEAGIPMKRFGKPEEVANVANFLASDEASYVSGSVYGVDGASGTN